MFSVEWWVAGPELRQKPEGDRTEYEKGDD